MLPRGVLVISVLALGAIAACGASTASTAPGGGAAAAVTITSSYSPRELAVVTGTTVTWTNTDDEIHNVHWYDGSGASPNLPTGDTYERTFDTPGTFGYMCDLHPLMTGEVTVTG